MRLDVCACALNPSISVPNDVQSATLISVDGTSFNKVSYECIYIYAWCQIHPVEKPLARITNS